MSIGTYGNIRPADVDIEDIAIYYSFAPNRETNPDIIYPLNAIEILTYNYLPQAEQIANTENLLEGMYTMQLPATVFNQLGIYTIYIKPKTFSLNIVDCGVLSSLPTIRGLIIDGNTLPNSNLLTNNALQGYKIEYLNSDGTKLRNTVRYVVTSNRVSVITENIGNTSQKATRYRFDDASNLIFLQLTPSSSSDTKPNSLPFLGTAGQTILISNTFFSPLVVEVEMVENTISTIANMIAGNQIKDVQNGILTYFDENNQIMRQFNLFEIKDDVTNVPLYEVKEKRTNIDESQDFNEVTGDIQ